MGLLLLGRRVLLKPVGLREVGLTLLADELVDGIHMISTDAWAVLSNNINNMLLRDEGLARTLGLAHLERTNISV